EQQEDDQERYRNYDLEARGRALEILILAAPHHVVALWKLNVRLHRALCIGDVAAEVAVADVDIDVGRQLSVLSPDGCRPARWRDGSDLAERDGAAGRHRHQDVARDCLRIVTKIAGITHVHGEALSSFYGRRHALAAKRSRDRVLHVLDHDAVARQG